MAEETPVTEQAKPATREKKPGKIKKILVFGVPAFLVQVVLIYFLTAKFVVPMTMHRVEYDPPDAEGQKHAPASSESSSSKEQYIYVVKDLIINPAGTNGQRYLLSTIAFNLSSEDAMKSLERKEMAVRDMLNSVLTSKTMDQLIDVTKRENLRQEIAAKATEMVEKGKLQSVYFSKYIVQ
jgi:flagellar FliL protein